MSERCLPPTLTWNILCVNAQAAAVTEAIPLRLGALLDICGVLVFALDLLVTDVCGLTHTYATKCEDQHTKMRPNILIAKYHLHVKVRY